MSCLYTAKQIRHRDKEQRRSQLNINKVMWMNDRMDSSLRVWLFSFIYLSITIIIVVIIIIIIIIKPLLHLPQNLGEWVAI